MNDMELEMSRFEEENLTLLDTLSTIHFNYVALQNGMSLNGIIDQDLRAMVEHHQCD